MNNDFVIELKNEDPYCLPDGIQTVSITGFEIEPKTKLLRWLFKIQEEKYAHVRLSALTETHVSTLSINRLDRLIRAATGVILADGNMGGVIHPSHLVGKMINVSIFNKTKGEGSEARTYAQVGSFFPI